MDSNRLTGQLFGTHKFTKTVYFLSYACGGRKKKEKRKKKMNKVEIFNFGFSHLLKVSGTFGVGIALEY